MDDILTAYICDGLDECSDKLGCFRCGKPGFDYCHHTTNPKHALNGPCDDPRTDPERFHKLNGSADGKDLYWEGEVILEDTETLLAYVD